MPPLDSSTEATETPSVHRVLLAEDDDEMRTLIALKLRSAGYELVEVDSGIALVSEVARMHANRAPLPSLIISDIRMPGLNGLAALRVIRDHGWRIPVVLITAFGSEETLNAASRLEASIVLHKPFDLDVLGMAVGCLLHEQH